jgi:hypothetical protein
MADLDRNKQASTPSRILGGDELYESNVNSRNELDVNDTPQQGVSAVLNLTTTAIELKVGASPLVNRKLIEMQALEKNVKWGYNTNCEFDLFKNQFFSLPCGENCTMYLKASTGTASVAVSEK